MRRTTSRGGGGGKKKSTATKKKSKQVQVGAERGASRYVSTDGPTGKQATKAAKYMKMKQRGKKLLRSEQNLINKYFNPTGTRKNKLKTKKK